MGMKCIGVDIGGTSVKIGLFETTGLLYLAELILNSQV